MNVCGLLRGYCLRHEWAANSFAFLGAALLLATVWVSLEYHAVLFSWVQANLLVNGLLFVTGLLLDSLLVFGLLCLGFSECSRSRDDSVHAYRGRRTPLFTRFHYLIDHAGTNLRRRRSHRS